MGQFVLDPSCDALSAPLLAATERLENGFDL